MRKYNFINNIWWNKIRVIKKYQLGSVQVIRNHREMSKSEKAPHGSWHAKWALNTDEISVSKDGWLEVVKETTCHEQRTGGRKVSVNFSDLELYTQQNTFLTLPPSISVFPFLLVWSNLKIVFSVFLWV